MKKTMTIALAVMYDSTVVREVPFDRHSQLHEADFVVTRAENGALEVWKDRYDTRTTPWTITGDEAEARLQCVLQHHAAK